MSEMKATDGTTATGGTGQAVELGAGAGLVFGAAFGNPGIGLVVGAAVGPLVGSALGARATRGGE